MVWKWLHGALMVQCLVVFLVAFQITWYTCCRLEPINWGMCLPWSTIIWVITSSIGHPSLTVSHYAFDLWYNAFHMRTETISSWTWTDSWCALSDILHIVWNPIPKTMGPQNQFLFSTFASHFICFSCTCMLSWCLQQDAYGSRLVTHVLASKLVTFKTNSNYGSCSPLFSKSIYLKWKWPVPPHWQKGVVRLPSLVTQISDTLSRSLPVFVYHIQISIFEPGLDSDWTESDIVHSHHFQTLSCSLLITFPHSFTLHGPCQKT